MSRLTDERSSNWPRMECKPTARLELAISVSNYSYLFRRQARLRGHEVWMGSVELPSRSWQDRIVPFDHIQLEYTAQESNLATLLIRQVTSTDCLAVCADLKRFALLLSLPGSDVLLLHHKPMSLGWRNRTSLMSWPQTKRHAIAPDPRFVRPGGIEPPFTD